MKLGIGWTPSVKALMQDHLQAGERAVTRAMQIAQSDLKQAWRGQIVNAGLGRRLSLTIRGANYPRYVQSLSAAAMVWSKAPHIVSAHNEGALIRARDGFWLAIPTEAAGRGRFNRRLTPGQWEERWNAKLRFVATRTGKFMLVADDARLNSKGQARRKGGKRRKSDGILTGAQTVVVFILLPQLKLKKRLDLDKEVRRVEGLLPGLIESNWES